MHGVINKSSLFMLSWKNFLQSWRRQSSSWWVLVVQRGAGFSSSSFFAFPLLQMNWILSARHPWERRNPTPPHLRAGGLSSSALQMWEESHVPFTAQLWSDVTEMPWVSPDGGTPASAEAERTRSLAAFLSQLCEDAPRWRSPGSLERNAGHSTSAGWLGRHIPGLGHPLWQLGRGRILLMKGIHENCNRSL